MTIDDVRDTILQICKDCEIEDLDVDMSDLFPGQPYRIGTFSSLTTACITVS